VTGTGFDLMGTLQLAIDLVIDFSSDFFAFIVIAAIVAAFAFYFGRDRIVSLLAGIYAAIPLYIAFPYTDVLTTPIMHVGLFLALVVVGMIAFSGLSSYVAGGSIGFINMTILSAVTAGVLIAVSIHILPVEQVYSFSAPTKALFASSESFFFWLLTPLLAVYFLGRG